MATPKPTPQPVKKPKPTPRPVVTKGAVVAVTNRAVVDKYIAQGRQRGPAVSAEQYQRGAERERAIARRPGMTLIRFGKTGFPVAVSQKAAEAWRAGKGVITEDSRSLVPKRVATKKAT